MLEGVWECLHHHRPSLQLVSLIASHVAVVPERVKDVQQISMVREQAESLLPEQQVFQPFA
jgi:hypothetical protein